MLIDSCIKFREYSLSGFQVIERAGLPFLHSARHLMLIDICIKFREYSFSGFQVIERTRFL